MKKLAIVLVIAALFGCSKKKEDDPFVLSFRQLLDRYMVCDSIRTTSSTGSTVQTIGKGNGQDLMFGNDASLRIYSNPQQLMGFQLGPPDKIYYFEDQVNYDQFYTVQSLTSNKLVIQNTDAAGIVLTRYMTAE